MQKYVHLLNAQTGQKQTQVQMRTYTRIRAHTAADTHTQQDPAQPLHQATLEGHVAL